MDTAPPGELAMIIMPMASSPSQLKACANEKQMSGSRMNWHTSPMMGPTGFLSTGLIVAQLTPQPIENMMKAVVTARVTLYALYSFGFFVTYSVAFVLFHESVDMYQATVVGAAMLEGSGGATIECGLL